MTYVILQGNCLDVLKTIPPGIIQTCVTSPPYFGLRDYGVANQIGLEATPQAYVEQLVSVFREVRRTLRDDGTLWLNLGDSYAGSWGAQSRGNTTGEAKSRMQGSSMLEARTIEAFPLKTNTGSLKNTPGLKNKDLIGIPWRVAFALQADGWYLRQDIIWHKPNPMPESVRDRCTKAHEYIFLLSKSEKYYFDAEAIKEARTQDESRPTFRGGAYVNNSTFDNSAGGKSTVVGNVRRAKDTSESARNPGSRSHNLSKFEAENGRTYGTRNKRSVWTVSPKPFKQAHFATFPPDLIRPCILAGAPKGKLVLDPFGGAGTTALVSESLGRHSISIELNPDYVTMARARVEASKIKTATQPLDSPPRI